MHVEGQRDPGRLLRGTQAWARRSEAQQGQERGVARDSDFILTHAGRREVPTWRASVAGG